MSNIISSIPSKNLINIEPKQPYYFSFEPPFYIFISLLGKRPPLAQAQFKKTGGGHPWTGCNKKDQGLLIILIIFYDPFYDFFMMKINLILWGTE